MSEDKEEFKETNDLKPSQEKRSRTRTKDADNADSKNVDENEAKGQSKEKGSNRRQSTGWGLESGDAPNVSANNVKSDEVEERSSRRGTPVPSRKAKSKHEEDDDAGETGIDVICLNEGIMEIPDLEEEEDCKDITRQVAEAPRNAGRKIPTLKELDNYAKYALPVSSDIDLSILTSALCPQMTVMEHDEKWDFDSLMAEVSHEVQKRLEDQAGSEKNPAVQVA